MPVFPLFRARTRASRAVGLFLLLLALATAIPGSLAAASVPASADRDLYSPVVPNLRDQIYQETSGLTRYQIEATLSPAGIDSLATIVGTLQLHYVNTTGSPLAKLYFRLYPNLAEYDTGSLYLASVRVGKEELTTKLSVVNTLATVTLPGTLAANDAIDLIIKFTTTIPTDPIGSYGMFSLDSQNDTYALAHWLPLLAGFDTENGWELDPPSQLGDPVFTNAALFDVQITAPTEMTLITTGSQVSSKPVGTDETWHHLVSGPVRDFVMAASTNLDVVSQKVGGTVVNSYYRPGSEDAGKTVLEAGAGALSTYSETFGAYPYKELDLVEISLGNGAGGVEFPQLVYIGSAYYTAGETSEAVPHFLEFVVAHEVAHQWWYGLVGNNQYLHAFMDEALANYSTILYFADKYGADAADLQIDYNLKAQYFSELFNQSDQIVDQPTDDFPSARSYGAVVYGKGALAFGAIQQAIGSDAFYAGLQRYFTDHEFGVASPDDLRAAFETASGQNLDQLWHHWFDTAEGRDDYDAADLANLLRAIGR